MAKLPNGLTEKEELFCVCYVKTRNGAKSARLAKYPENSARQTAYELITKPYIRERIDELIEEELKTLDNESWNREVKALAQANIQDFVTIDDNGLAEPKKITDMPRHAMRCIKKIKQNRVIKELEDGSTVLVADNFEFELWDKTKALDLYGKATKRFDTKELAEMPPPILIKAESGSHIAMLGFQDKAPSETD